MSDDKDATDVTDTQTIFDAWLPSSPEMRYVLVGMAMLYISTRLMKAGTSHIFALLACYFIVQWMQQQDTTSVDSFNGEMDYRLDMLGSPSLFHRDTDLINLFYSIYGWREWNANNFDLAIKAVNNVLQVESDSEKPLVRCFDNYDVAYDQAKIALNMIHGFIYSISEPILVQKLKKVLSRLNQLLQRHLVNIQQNCMKLEDAKDTIDVNSRFLEDANGPKPYDGATMSQFDYY